MKKHNCIVVLGPTASGKTRIACSLAHAMNGEIISADSRQVYRQLDIGTGKDFDEYRVQGTPIPYHLIDIAEPGEQFYLHNFVQRLREAFDDITLRKKLPIICGGTGLYLDALTKDFSLTEVKENQELRAELEVLPKEVLLARLGEFPPDLVKHVDVNSKKRIIRGIEVADFMTRDRMAGSDRPATVGNTKEAVPYKPYYIGINAGLNERKDRIARRLQARLSSGLIEEVETLLKKGIDHERLQRLGLEYKFVSFYLLGKITKEELFVQLQTAIFQFAKRQMTWFRKMEREGVEIHWLEQPHDITPLIDKIEKAFKE